MNQRVGVTCCLMFLMLIALGSWGGSELPGDYSDALLVLPGAKNLGYEERTNPEDINEVFQQVIYYGLDRNFPAQEEIELIEQHLERKGWRNTTEGHLPTPLFPSLQGTQSKEWFSYIDATVEPNATVHQWYREWRNEDGEMIVYALEYRSSDRATLDHPDNDQLIVNVVYQTAKAVGRADEMWRQMKNDVDLGQIERKLRQQQDSSTMETSESQQAVQSLPR